jgi:hypothetical protein
MGSTHRRLVLFLSGVVCAIWLLAIHAFLDDLLHNWPSRSSVQVTADAPPLCVLQRCAVSGGERSWKLRTRPVAPPITATAIPLDDDRWGLHLCGVFADDDLFAMGFRDGDVLLAVDGWHPSSPRGALSAYGRILTAEAHTAEVSRASSIVTIVVPNAYRRIR